MLKRVSYVTTRASSMKGKLDLSTLFQRGQQIYRCTPASPPPQSTHIHRKINTKFKEEKRYKPGTVHGLNPVKMKGWAFPEHYSGMSILVGCVNNILSSPAKDEARGQGNNNLQNLINNSPREGHVKPCY